MTDAAVSGLDACAGAFVEELAGSGLRHVCIAPGARSTPLAIFFRQHPGVRLWTHLDERSAAFFALGIAKALREPAAVVSTSGTAAVNFAPAVAEARYSHTPLLVLTADRPPELRDVGANQTIDQLRLYGTHAKWSLEMPVPGPGEGAVRYFRTMACRALAAARSGVPGPVHVNLPFREPLVPSRQHLWEAGQQGPYVGVFQAPGRVQSSELGRLAGHLRGASRGLIVCGPQDAPGFAEAVARLAAQLGYPVLADPLSQVRCGPHHGTFVVDAYDLFLRNGALAARLAPEVVLRFGATPTSKVLLRFLQRHWRARHVLVAPGGWNDPSLVARDAFEADATSFCLALLEELGPGPLARSRRRSAWSERWRRVNAQARESIAPRLLTEEGISEPGVFLRLPDSLPAGATVFVGNSMPVRDLDSFLPGGSKPLRFMANRGASGIDGVVSTALGVAAVSPGPVVLVIGDLSFYHDMNGLLAAKRYALRATIVLLNNDGGGIFSLLPQSETEHFEELFAMPHGLDFRHVADLYGLAYRRPAGRGAFEEAVREAVEGDGCTVIEVRTDRRANADLHREVWRAVAGAPEARGGRAHVAPGRHP